MVNSAEIFNFALNSFFRFKIKMRERQAVNLAALKID
jgi:hypothetical protein